MIPLWSLHMALAITHMVLADPPEDTPGGDTREGEEILIQETGEEALTIMTSRMRMIVNDNDI